VEFLAVLHRHRLGSPFARLGQRDVAGDRLVTLPAASGNKGTKSGKPIGGPRIPARIEAAIAKALQEGKQGIHKIAAKNSVGVGVVQRIKAAL
jgi:hypothetical protein